MKVYFNDDSSAQLRDWIKKQPRTALKIIDLIDNIRETPFEGLGKPERLKHELTGLWSRRITQEHRLVYIVMDDEVEILSCYGHYT